MVHLVEWATKPAFSGEKCPANHVSGLNAQPPTQAQWIVQFEMTAHTVSP